MPITNGAITIGTVATLIAHAGVNPGNIHVSNLDVTDSMFIGGAAVTVNGGHALFKSTSEDFAIYPGQSIYAISSKAGHSIAYTLITP